MLTCWWSCLAYKSGGLGSSGWSCFEIFCAAVSRFFTEISNSSLAARFPYLYHSRLHAILDTHMEPLEDHGGLSLNGVAKSFPA
jgi:hypothetical protein